MLQPSKRLSCTRVFASPLAIEGYVETQRRFIPKLQLMKFWRNTCHAHMPHVCRSVCESKANILAVNVLVISAHSNSTINCMGSAVYLTSIMNGDWSMNDKRPDQRQSFYRCCMRNSYRFCCQCLFDSSMEQCETYNYRNPYIASVSRHRHCAIPLTRYGVDSADRLIFNQSGLRAMTHCAASNTEIWWEI